MRFSQLFDYFNKAEPRLGARPLHCVFYSHIWTVYCLEGQGLLNPKTDIVVELATESHFSRALAPLNNQRGNLLGLLQPGRHLQHLGVRYQDIAAPMILAPSQPAQINAVLSALALLSTDPSPIERAVVLVNVCDGPAFADAFPYMSGFSILWDIADYPNAALPALAQALAAGQCLDGGHWGGFHLCNHKHRQLPDAPQRQEALRQLLDGFAGLTAG